MKISVVMIDGEFRDNTFGAEYFSKQDFPDEDFEVIWVEFYSKVPESVRRHEKVKVVTLGNPKETVYHSSYCFNKGIELAQGELIVIPDADQVVMPDFLRRLWELHAGCDKLVVYPYRYDEIKQGALTSLEPGELDAKCVLMNPLNYGGCLSVRKKWLLAINGYEQSVVFSTGFHANGLDMYTRFKNYGMAIMWAPELKLYHPWHPFTRAESVQYDNQLKVINYRKSKLVTLPFEGIDAARNTDKQELDQLLGKLLAPPKGEAKKSFLKRIFS